MHSCSNIDEASRSVKYDAKRKMSYFRIAISDLKTSLDLFNEVQKWIYMVELYHLNLRSNITDLKGNDPETSKYESEKDDLHKKRDYTVKEMLYQQFYNSDNM